MSWIDIETAMQQAIVDASGLPAGQVIWSYQNVNEPTLDFIVIHFGGETVIGIDRVVTNYDPTRPAGQEILQDIRGVREVPLTLSVYTADRTGEHAARRLAEKVRTKLRLPSIRFNLRDVGLTPFDPGPVQYVPDVLTAGFRGRAICTIRCYVPVMDCNEYTTYIQRITGTLTAYYATGLTAAQGSFDSQLASGYTGFYPPG